MSFRIDADYRDPLAAKGVPPFRVVHRWREDGRPREHTQLISALPATYTIETAGRPRDDLRRRGDALIVGVSVIVSFRSKP